MLVELSGVRADGAEVRREARLGFVSESTKLLRLRLERACFGVPCVDEQTKGGNGVVVVMIGTQSPKAVSGGNGTSIKTYVNQSK